MFNKKLLNYFIIILLFGFFVLFFQAGALHSQCADDDLGCDPKCQEIYGESYDCIEPDSDNRDKTVRCIEGIEYAPGGLLKYMCPGQCPTVDPSDPCTKCCKIKPGVGVGAGGDYTLNDLMRKVVGLARWIFGITGSLALLFFIYGGVMFLISGGNSERVTKAKQIIIGAVIGLIIVFTAYMIIGFVMKTMGATSITGWATSDWFQ